MKCPKCKEFQLKQAMVKGSSVRIDFCSHCKGFWLDIGEMEKISELAIKNLSLPEHAKRTFNLCPHCELPLYEFDYPQTLVSIDMCRKCKGLWIDRGELKEIEVVRQQLKDRNRIHEYDKIPGAKGALIRFVDRAIENLWYYD